MQKQQEKPMRQQKKFNVLGPVATDFGASTTGNWRLERPQVDFASCIKCRTCENIAHKCYRNKKRSRRMW